MPERSDDGIHSAENHHRCWRTDEYETAALREERDIHLKLQYAQLQKPEDLEEINGFDRNDIQRNFRISTG